MYLQRTTLNDRDKLEVGMLVAVESSSSGSEAWTYLWTRWNLYR